MRLRIKFSIDHDVVWSFEAEEKAEFFLKDFMRAMGLSPAEGESGRRIHFEVMTGEPGKFFGPHLLQYARCLQADEWKIREFPGMIFFQHPGIREIICEIDLAEDLPIRIHQMRRAMLPVYIDALLSGGLPVHGALVELDGQGVILAGRSGEGKSTACRRIPTPWRVLGDDLCLVVRGVSGEYRVHPLPTWSAFGQNNGSGACQSGTSVPLRAVIFLEQSPTDEVLPLKKSEAAISLAGSSLEVFRSIDFEFPRGEERNVKRALYENSSSIAMAIPAYHLRLSLTGRFWEKIEEILGQMKQSKGEVGLDADVGTDAMGRVQRQLFLCEDDRR